MKFSEVYIKYYCKLLRFASEFVNDVQEAENLVQDAFLGLWKSKDELERINNMNAYMFRLVRNRCLDYLKHKANEQEYAKGMLQTMDYRLCALDSFNETGIFMCDLEKDVADAIAALPQRCREIFVMSRYEGKKYREIAEAMGISENTVEIQMGIAIKRMRVRLAQYIA
ncbi:MAG: RNA polymerase sigma-70 factor [Muribaculaceae bacterium]